MNTILIKYIDIKNITSMFIKRVQCFFFYEKQFVNCMYTSLIHNTLLMFIFKNQYYFNSFIK